MSDEIDPLSRLAALREQEGKAYAGNDDAWKAAVETLTRKQAAGELSPTEIAQRLSKATAGGDLFYAGMAEADEAAWRKWRDNQPRRKARIDATRR